jgi:hypothetical protein
MVSLHIVRKTRPGTFSVTKTDLLPKDEDDADAGLLLRGPTRRVCLVCKAKASAYACPRCATPYCSAACYKGHNQGCTEGFYQQHVEKEMRLRQAEEGGGGPGGPPGGPAARQATVDAIRRVRLEGQGTGQGWLEMEDDRLEELWARGDALDLEALTPEEQRAFRAAIASGELGKDVEVWTPWWCQGGFSTEGKPLVMVEEGGLEGEAGEAVAVGGTGRGASVDFASLYRELQREKVKAKATTATSDPSTSSGSSSSSSSSSSKPSTFLKYHLLDLLFAYVAVLRTYNGCWRVAPQEAAEDLLALSPVLQQQQQQHVVKKQQQQQQQQQLRLESAAGALASSLTALRQWKGTDTTTATTSSSSSSSPFSSSISSGSSSSLAMGLAIAQDVTLLLEYRIKTQAALLDAGRMVRAALQEVVMEEGGEEKQQQQQQQQEDDEIRLLTTMVEALSCAAGKEEGTKRRKGSKERRQAGRRLLRLWHKLHFFLQWSFRDGEEEREEEWRGLRIEFGKALHEHQEVVASRGGQGRNMR